MPTDIIVAFKKVICKYWMYIIEYIEYLTIRNS